MVKRHEYDCGDGVLHIPPARILSLLDKGAQELSDKLAKTYTPYKHGVNASWFHECSLKEGDASSCVLRREFQKGDDTCDVAPQASCFRGVHDGIINKEEVSDVLDLAEHLISTGYDHITVHNDVKLLTDHIPAVVEKLKGLLKTYAVPNIRPVAFHISVNLPIGWNPPDYDERTSRMRDLYRSMNQTTYDKWVEKVKSMNYYPMLSFRRPFRDACVLLSDLEASREFSFHTSVSLSDGAGEDFSGGASLYVDNHESNTNPGKKIQRGIVVDGSRGRVIVSTGGDDNLRCRLPMREGIRVELHIWWDCV